MLMENKNYRIGLFLIILSFLACVISYYFVVIGLPVFLIGAAFVFFSKNTLKRKLLTIFLPILLLIPTSIIFLYLYGLKTAETYLIPASVKRGFRVIYDEKCGIEPLSENGRRILMIPENGILIIKTKHESGWMNHEYYFVDLGGNKIKVGEIGKGLLGSSKNDSSLVESFGTGKMSGVFSNKPYNIHYSDFIIKKHKNDSIFTSGFYEDGKIDSLTRVLVEKCRTNK
jgi:energy-coupling factor transporter transmembrane protein EcfT